MGSIGNESEPSTPTRLSEVLTAKSFRKAIVKKGNSLKSLKSLILETEPVAKTDSSSSQEVPATIPETKVIALVDVGCTS